MIEQNAEITSVSIEIEDHGILSAWINLRFDSQGAGFGGYGYSQSHRDGPMTFSPNLSKFIRKAMEVVGVSRWEDLKGKSCRVRHDGIGGRVAAIGNFMKDDWLNIAELHAKE